MGGSGGTRLGFHLFVAGVVAAVAKIDAGGARANLGGFVIHPVGDGAHAVAG